MRVALLALEELTIFGVLLCSGNSRLALYVTQSAVTGREGQVLACHTGPLTFVCATTCTLLGV